VLEENKSPQISVFRGGEHPRLIFTPSESRAYGFGLDDMSDR
jgi:hypothetical protein